MAVVGWGGLPCQVKPRKCFASNFQSRIISLPPSGSRHSSQGIYRKRRGDEIGLGGEAYQDFTVKELQLGGVKDNYDCLLSYMHSNTQLSDHWVNPFHFLLRKYNGLIENKNKISRIHSYWFAF